MNKNKISQPLPEPSLEPSPEPSPEPLFKPLLEPFDLSVPTIFQTITNELTELKNKITQLEQAIKVLKTHQHLGEDGSDAFRGATEFHGKSLTLSVGGREKKGSRFIPAVLNILDDTEQQEKKQRVLGMSMAVVNEKDSAEEQIQGFLGVGKSIEKEDMPSIMSQANFKKINSAQLSLIHLPQGEPTPSGPSSFPSFAFLTANRTPSFAGQGVITQGGNTLSDSDASFSISFAGSVISLYDDKEVLLETKKIIGNTEKTITIDGTWTSPSGSYRYVVITTIFLGSAEKPFSRLFVGEDIRMGYGASGGKQVQFIKWGMGAPEGKVPANTGSLYLKRAKISETEDDGILYVKEKDDIGGDRTRGWKRVSLLS